MPVGVACSKTPGRATVPGGELWAAALDPRLLFTLTRSMFIGGITAHADGKKRLESGHELSMYEFFYQRSVVEL